MLSTIIQAFWFISPAMVSNMMPVWAKKIRLLAKLDIPVDGGKTLNGKPIFGRNKTFRGFVAGVTSAALVGLLQYALSEQFGFIDELEFYNMQFNDYLALSTLLGFGALLGDVVESMVKRQLEIKPGEPWFPMDQLDYVFGALLLSTPLVMLSLSEYLAVIAVGFTLHPLATYIGYKLGLKERPI